MSIADFISTAINEVTGGAQTFGARAANAAPAAAPVAPSAPAMPAVGGAFPAPPTGVASAAAGLPLGASPMRGSSVVDRLPPKARAKLPRIFAAADDMDALCDASYARLEEAQSDMQRHEARVRFLDSRPGGMNGDDPGRIDAAGKAAAARAEVERLRSLHSERSESSRPIRELRFRLQRYVDGPLASAAIIEPAEAVAVPQLKPGETYVTLVERARAKIEKIKLDLQSAIDAPWPSSIAMQRARDEINDLAERGAPRVMALLESRGGKIEWPQRYRLADVAFDGGGRPVALAGRDRWEPDAVSLIAWLCRDELLRRVESEISERADDSAALDETTRAKKIQQATRAIYEAELLEEHLVELCEESGTPVVRRVDADVRCVLGLSNSMTAPRASSI